MRRRKAGIFGFFLVPSGFVKVVAGGLAVLMVVSATGDSVRDQLGDEAAYAALHRPGQVWGSAADGAGTHFEGTPANRTLPASVRSRYPKQTWEQQVDNTVTEAEPPLTEVKGFDEKASAEQPARRSEYERVYANPDGSETTEFSTSKLNYRGKDGTWTPIDPTLVDDQGKGWRNAAGEVGLRFAGRSDAADLVTLTVDDDHSVSYTLAGAAASTPQVDGATIVYPGVAPKVDLKLESRAGGVKETLVLAGPDAPTRFTFPLRLKGLTPQIDNGQVVFKDEKGEPRAVIPPGDMVDAKGSVSRAVSYRLVQGALELTVDEAWLKDPIRAFPVAVDPTVALPVGSGPADASMTAGSAGSGELAIGSNANAYIKFGDLVNRLQYHTIFGAQLWLVNFDAESCNPRQVDVHPVTENWSSGSGTYPGPAVGATLASKSFAHGYIAFGQPASACPRAGELFNLGGAGRDLVQRWVNGEQPNYGLSIRGAGAKKFTDRGTANPPKLYVTHSPYNATYKLTDPRPNPPVLQNQDGKVKITVTNKSAAAWAPGDYYLAYRAYKSDGAAVTQQRAANLTATVQRNGKVTLDATIKAMPPGKYFLDFTMVKTGGPVFTDHQVPPGRIILQVFDIPPVVQELFPPNGYQTPTLTPQLWARALDVDAPPSSALQFKFELCERDPAGKPINCTNSGYGTKTAWPVPSGTLSWTKTYMWRAFVKDATTEVPSPYSVLLANVPQPEITARVSTAPNGLQDQDFDPQTGNLTTSAVDATVGTAGPALSVTRTYNSIDPRRDGLFGAGWTSVFDMKVVSDDDGSGSVVVTYPDGQTVRFGRNANGTYVAPGGRTASLTLDSTSWKLLDKSGTTYQFALTGKLSKITDVSNRSTVLTYQDGKLRKAQVANSQTNTAGRSLTFTWTGNHVTKLDTDPVGGAALSWAYSYTGDLLTKVCGPTPGCTNYEYSAGSHYRSAVLDSRPESYWRLGEDEGTAAASEVAVNLGKDTGTYKNVTLNAAGQLAGATDTAASFNGTTSTVDLPKGTVKKSRDGAIELWFKNSITGSGGPLIGYQDKALGSASTTGVPVLYVGTDGKLRGQFGTGSITPITTSALVNDGKWHHVVLSSMGSTQTLYLDGAQVGELTGKTIDHTLLTFNQIGAAYASTPGSWPAWGTTAQRSYSGLIDEVAVYAGPLGAASVMAHHKAATAQADLLSKVTLPSGRVDALATYDVGRDRVKQYTDNNGGVWKVGAPTVYGGDTDLRRSIEVLDPGNRTSLYEFDAISGQLLRLGQPLGMEARPEDKPGEPAETPPDPVRQCTQPDPNDPAFCTVIPDDSGGPVFVRYGVDGVSIRTFEYNDEGVLTTVRDENGNPTTMTYDARGNVTSTKTCRDTDANQCQTSYKSYPATVTNLYDPRNDLPTENRDARSASATDNTYRTQYAYHSSGQLATQTSPDGAQTSYKYTTGSEGAVGGGTQPAGLVDSVTNARGKITKYAYFSNGDLAKVTEPSGRSTEYTYDQVGRMITKKDVSDSFPAGVVTTYTYDGMSRLRTTTLPVTTNAVTGVKHQKRITSTYDPDGNVTSVETADALGNDQTRTASSTLDDHGRAITTTDPEGGQTWFDYDVQGNVTSTTDSNGNRYDYAYTARNTLAEVRLRDWRSDPEGAPATGDHLVLKAYSYDFAGRLASETDAMGRRTEYTYFDDGLLAKAVLKKFRNPDGTTRDFVLEDNTYDAAGNPVKQVRANGKTVKTSTYDKLGRVATATADPSGLMRSTAFTYDGNGNVKTVTTTGKPSNVPWITGNSQEQVSYDYDDADNLIQETVTNGTVSRVTKTKYDQRGLATSTVDPRGNATGADPNAFTARLTYDEIGQRVTSTAAPLSVESGGQAASTATPSASTGYNTFGEMTEYKDEIGNVSRTTYDRNGRSTSSAKPSYQAPGATQAVTPTTFTKYDGNSNIVEVKDPRGNITRSTYDQLNRVAKVDVPASTNDERAVTTFGYTRSGQVLSTVDPTGIRSEATYDDLDRQVTATSIERTPVAGAFTSRAVFDDVGNVVNEISPKQATTTYTFDTLNQLTRSVDPNGVQVQYGYDFAGHTVRAVDAQGRTSQVIYDLFGQKTADNVLKADGSTLRSTTFGYDVAGNLITVTDPDQTVRTYTYNSANQLINQVEPVADNKSITSSYGVDAAGRRTRYTDGRGNSTITTYNSLGVPESTIDPPTTAHPNAADRTWTTGYDENGNAVQMTAPGGVVTKRVYDAANRPTSETGTGAEAQTAAATYGYDLSNRLRSASAVGGTNTYTYDDRGNLFTTAGPGGVAEYRYDEEGSVISRADAAGTAAYVYDKGRLDTVADGLTGTSQKFGYDNTGEVKTIDFGAGRKRTLGYDDFGRLSSDVMTNSANATVASTTYGYNRTDTVASRTTTGVAGAGTTTYDYDKGYRLKSSTAGGVTTGYEWDDAGNRTKIGSKASTFDERNRLLSDGDSTYAYSARGTLRSKTTGSQVQQAGFDALDRMITNGAQTYAYDGFDRVATRNGTTFTYAGQNDEIVSDGTETYARGPGDELVATNRGGTKRLSISDSHGDVVGGFDPADTTLGALPDSTTYDPFGKVTAKAGNTGALGYQGDWTDQATGQVDMGARWYDPATGGFVSRDDVDTSGGSALTANRYGYGAGNPVTNTDPTGHFCPAGKGYTVCAPRLAPDISVPKKSWWSRIGKGAKWGFGRISIPLWAAWQVLKPTQMPYDGCERWSGGMSCGDYFRYSHNPTSVRDQFCDTHPWTSQCGGGGGRSPWEQAADPDSDTGQDTDGDGDVDPQDDTAARAEAARIAAYLRAKAISDRARADNANAAKHTPIAVDPAATKPILLDPDQVSSTPKAPAGRVGTVRDVVDDARTDVDSIYQTAVRAVGQLQHNVSSASRAVVVTIHGSDQPDRLISGQHQRQKRDCRQTLPSPNYMPVDSAHGNRATGVEACVTKTYGENKAKRGPGYEWAQNHVSQNYGATASLTINSCHLLAAVLGGEGKKYENVATCSRAANYWVRGAGRLEDNMRAFEREVATAVREGQVVYYKVIPKYAGDRTIPVSFEMTAEGFYKNGRPGGINKNEVVPNSLYNQRGSGPGLVNLGLLQDSNGNPAPTGYTK
ncbi:RHS repeat-associated core domain-containing protein [Lentzea waywayandensis]|uniref:RHS repeat-associated core domain-containing protein n=1 Tax=Lentzea waywayandensis TaxID=84724 RepID=A0A1I6D3Q3_9PSEU|nr:RHS repeat-associated core domain-containing protein [Lentzea waywayandensis]SFQ99982.1 RHS repeat-associated core domain-containing protein [Lentzea waywayandensis]